MESYLALYYILRKETLFANSAINKKYDVSRLMSFLA
jgi:hypothetical protein